MLALSSAIEATGLANYGANLIIEYFDNSNPGVLLSMLFIFVAIKPIKELTITIAEIDSIIFSVIETTCHSFVSTIPGIIACRGSNS